MSEHALKLGDVDGMFRGEDHRKLVLSTDASKRVSDLLGLDAPGQVHIIVRDRPAAEEQGERPRAVARAAEAVPTGRPD